MTSNRYVLLGSGLLTGLLAFAAPAEGASQQRDCLVASWQPSRVTLTEVGHHQTGNY